MASLHDLLPKYLRTQRLTLERFDHSPAHYETLLGVTNSPTAHKNMGDFGIRTPAHFDKHAAAARLRGDRFANELADDDFYYLARLGADRGDGESIGGISLCQRVTTTTTLPPDIGWGLLEPYMGKGYATEAAAELLRFVREDLGYGEIVVFPNDRNKPSNRVAEKLGFVDGGEVPNLDEPGTMVKLLVLPGMGDLGLKEGLPFKLKE